MLLPEPELPSGTRMKAYDFKKGNVFEHNNTLYQVSDI